MKSSTCDLTSADLSSKYAHLTNYSINKKNEKYIQNDVSDRRRVL